MNLIAKIHTNKGVKFQEIQNFFDENFEIEIINLPEGSTPFSVMKMTDAEIDAINAKTLKDIEEMDAKARTLSEEYCADYDACRQLVYNDPLDSFLEYNCLKSGGAIKAQWLKCIQSKKQKALKMLSEEKVIAEKDGDNLASEEIDSLCELINEIDQTAKETMNNVRSEKEVLNYWPALLLPAPKMNIPDGDEV